MPRSTCSRRRTPGTDDRKTFNIPGLRNLLLSSFSLSKCMSTQLFLLKVEHYCALEGLIVLLILMFEIAVLCRRVPDNCQALLPTDYLLSTAAYQLPNNAISLTLPLITDWGTMRHL